MSLPQDVVTDGAAPHTPTTFNMFQPQLPGVTMPWKMAPRSQEFEARLATFRPAKMASSFQLASAGFSYDEKSKTAKCLECGCKAGANGATDPLKLHIETSPECSFFKFKPAATSNSLPQTKSPASLGAPEMKTTTSLTSPKYSQYQEHATRLVTYQGWPLDVVKQSPEYLAKCGFFYIGSADRVRCFFCGITLRNWEAEDDPYEEHKNWAPRCTFIQNLPRPERQPVSILGEASQEETNLKGSQSSSESSPLPQPLHHHGAHQHHHGENTDCSNSTSSGSHQSQPPAPSASEPQVGPGTSDIMSSPSVLAVIDMGFARDVVEKVVHQEVAKGSTRYSNAVALFTAVEDYLANH